MEPIARRRDERTTKSGQNQENVDEEVLEKNDREMNENDREKEGRTQYTRHSITRRYTFHHVIVPPQQPDSFHSTSISPLISHFLARFLIISSSLPVNLSQQLF